jgi:hypothetical protein
MSDDIYGIRPEPPDPKKGRGEGARRQRPPDDPDEGRNPYERRPGAPPPYAYDVRRHDDGGGGGSGGGTIIGWVIFILIFGVGNFILYKTTGIFIIPIPRR